MHNLILFINLATILQKYIVKAKKKREIPILDFNKG